MHNEHFIETMVAFCTFFHPLAPLKEEYGEKKRITVPRHLCVRAVTDA